jgi:hypothetical protein
MMVLSCSTLDWRSKKTTQPRKKLNLKMWFDSTYCVPQLRGVRLFTIQGEMFMSIRIQNSDRKIAKNSNATATISRGRCDAILEGNKIISLQKSGYEMRNHYADATLKQLADSIYAMLNRKASKKINSDIYSLEYGINKMGIRDRLKQIEIMKQRKAGLLVA